MTTFAEKIKRLREAAGLTQAQLAQGAGLSLGIVRDYEQSKKEPTLRSAFKLAEALGVSCEAFKDCLDGSPEPVPPPKGKKGKAAGQAGTKRKGKGA
jgi:transcriptional regulator with XRE-family HTH domain